MTTETVSGAMYDAMSLALKDIEAVLARHSCPAGATMTDWIDEQLTALAATAKPIDMLLLCPACGMQHIDAVETGTTLSRSGLDTLTETEVVTWSNPPQRTHMCHGCGHQWRPADVATNGVAELKTKGRNDSPRVVREVEPFAQCLHGDNEATCQACIASSARIGSKAVGVRAVVPLSDFSVELRFYSCRQAQAFIRAAQQQAEPVGDEPPLGGHWHFGNGVVVCGTLRIFGEDFDTDPADDFKESLLKWVCDTLNAAQDAYRSAQSGQRAGVAQTAAARDVLAERARQMTHEGWTPAHDDAHTQMEMAAAAAVYALYASGWDKSADAFWPWSGTWWKPSTPRRNLVKAGALILAEIERLDRAIAPTQHQEAAR